MNVRANWELLEAWLSANAPEIFSGLRAGADDAKIAEIEDKMGVVFPEAVRECYRRHDGQHPTSPWLFNATEYLSLDRMLDEWAVWKDLLDGGDFEGAESEPSPGVKSDWWNAAWIPFTYNGGGDHLCVDLDPASEGTRGQIIEMWHDMGDRPLLAPSFDAWFADFTRRVVAGDYVLSDEYGGLLPKGELG